MFEVHMIDAVGRSEADYARGTLANARRRMEFEHDLKLLRAETRGQRPAPVRWLGERLIGLGERLRADPAPRITRRA